MKTIFVGPQGIRAPYRTLAERVLPRARVAYRRPAWNGGEGTGVAYPRSYVSRFGAGLRWFVDPWAFLVTYMLKLPTTRLLASALESRSWR
jgi:hypothetical protein